MTKKGFTLIEILIVLLILGLLASIVLPQFGSTTDNARIQTAEAIAANYENAIELYRAQHQNYPGQSSAGGGANCPTEVNPAAPATLTQGTNDDQHAINQLVYPSNRDGQVCAENTTTYRFGPYLKQPSAEFPENPVNNSIRVTVVNGGLAAINDVTDADRDGIGWLYNPQTGQFQSAQR